MKGSECVICGSNLIFIFHLSSGNDTSKHTTDNHPYFRMFRSSLRPDQGHGLLRLPMRESPGQELPVQNGNGMRGGRKLRVQAARRQIQIVHIEKAQPAEEHVPGRFGEKRLQTEAEQHEGVVVGLGPGVRRHLRGADVRDQETLLQNHQKVG